MRNLIITMFKGVLAIIAILNLVLLYGFGYQNPFEVINDGKELAETASTIATTNEEVTMASTEAEEKAEEASTIASTVPEYKEKKCVVVSKKNARIRSGPSTDYERITSVPNGTILTIVGEEDGWYHVRTNDEIEGYISKDLVEVLE